MSKLYRERHSLLQDENSDEESLISNTSPKFQRRFYYSSSGRASAQVIGAASIIKRWPDHLTTLLTYWWLGLGMIAVLVFITYNTILAVAALPPSHPKPLKTLNSQLNFISRSHENSEDRNIYMHVFVNCYEDLKINDYMPYIETFLKKYPNFTYNFIVVINDASNDAIEDLSDELKNELALNSLWNEKENSDVQLFNKKYPQVISLSKYMDESPLKKYWRRLPKQFIGFLTRCIAIWNKGGIALDPIILTPKSPNPMYIEKLEQILSSGNLKVKKTHTSKKLLRKPKKKVNNIQDIINTLENEDNVNSIEENMIEAENIDNVYKVKNPYKNKIKRNIKLADHKNDNKSETYDKIYENNPHKLKNENDYLSLTSKENEKQAFEDTTTKQGLLPMFLKYLFHQEPTIFKKYSLSTKNITKNDTHDDISNSLVTSSPILNTSRDMIPNTQSIDIYNKISINNNHNKSGALLTLDLEANLIATETPCHAFIGTIFSNVIHYTNEESIRDLIITELSLFCKGTLSSCKGIEVILL
ncbi:unnamed protein product, partial [Brenthis ino]